MVVVLYNMAREAPRTLYSLSATYQRNIDEDDYEVIVVDNGSQPPFHQRDFANLAGNFRLIREQQPRPSPARAINRGLAEARGTIVGMMIDGARIASPGLLSTALAASRVHPRPMIGTLTFHLGSQTQMESIKHGYNQTVEDELLLNSNWESDGYSLFSVSTFAGSSSDGWFRLPRESNAIFLRTEHWRALGGYDERFEMPGGGLVNLDAWSRICADEQGELIMLLGEATFHQFHGGIATNNPNSPWQQFHDEYVRIHGRAYSRPTRCPLYFGTMPPEMTPSLRASLAQV